jgi:hypothetical protein
MRFFNRLAEGVRGWARADILAAVAIVISVMSLYLSLRADKRTHQANQRGAEAVAAALYPKVEELAKTMETSAMFIETFVSHARANPQEASRTADLALNFLRSSTLSQLTLPPEYLAMLTNSDNDAAAKLALCISRRDDIEADIKIFSSIKDNKITSSQRSTLGLLPYRMRKLNEACEGAAKSLAAIAPHSLLNGPMRGTIGETLDAEEEAMYRKKAGLLGTLHLSAKKPKEKN